MNRTTVRTAVAVATLGFAFATALPAVAGDNEVIERGDCSGSGVWKLKAKPDDGRLEVEGEVDTNRNGQTWHWKIKNDGVVVRKGTSVTRGASGSFSVERKIANGAGQDHIVFKAKRAGTAQTCRGSLRI